MAQRIYSPRFEPLALWGEDPATGRRVVVGQHEKLQQISIQTPQTRKAQWFPVEHKSDADSLIAAYKKAIESLEKMRDSLPDAPVATTPAARTTAPAALPENVVTTDTLTTLLKAMQEQQMAATAALIEKSVNAVLAAQSPKPVASVSGNGQTAVTKL